MVALASPIAKAASLRDNFRWPTLYYRSAREGFADALRALLSPTDRKVLLPAFIGWSPREGSGVFDPIRQLDAQPGFYALHPNLTVDIAALERAMDEQGPRLVVVIHYFGRTDPNLMALGELVRRHGAILVEDLAHGFFSAFGTGGQAGTVGDISLFSLHKMFPTPLGGMVRYRDPSLMTAQQGTAADLAEFIAGYDWTGIGLRRRANFEAVAESLSHSLVAREHCELLWPSLRPSDVPQTLPVRLRDINRDDVYQAMNADGFGMTSLYHTMIDVLHDGFPDMMEVSKSIINFPVHQDMMPDQADAMVRSFERAVATARRF